MSSEPLFGAIETGGTKTVVGIADAQGRFRERQRIVTSDGPATMHAAIAFLRVGMRRHGPLRGVGVAAFGPLHLDARDPRHGHLGATPKAGWSSFDLLGELRAQLQVPVALDTDVNAAAAAEQRWGAGLGCDPVVYVTVGTGIGGGVYVHGRTLHGLMHAEMGHIHPRRHPEDAVFPGICPFHRDCLEGLASGPAIIARHGVSLERLPAEHPAWRIEADYLGQLCAHIVTMLAPQRLILGGGVMQAPGLLALVRARTRGWLADYMPPLASDAALAERIVAPTLGSEAGIRGALLLALEQAAST